MPIVQNRLILRCRRIPTRRPWYRLLYAAAWPVVVAPGCSGDWTFALPAVQAGAPDVRFESACATAAQASCAYQQRCFLGASFGWENIGECVARETLACELAAADENVSFDENRIRGCQYPSDCTSPPPNCYPPGNAAAGRPCLRNAACQSGICLGGGARGSLCGVCGDCNSGCSFGQMCDAIVSRIDCVSQNQPAGPPCTSSDQCPARASCIEGGCVAAAQDGAHCDPTQGLLCLWPAECVASQCIFPTLADCPL